MVTYRKARSALLETARQNVTESAVRKGENLQYLIKILQSTLLNTVDNTALTSDDFAEKQEFIERQIDLIPQYLDCVKIINVENKNVTNTTCNSEKFTELNYDFWPRQKSLETKPDMVYIKYIFPKKSEKNNSQNIINSNKQLQLLLAVPIYNSNGILTDILSYQVSLLKLEVLQTGSLTGYPVVINEDGKFLVHPFSEKIGQNIRDEKDYLRLEILLKNAIAGRQDFLHLFSLEQNNNELLAGYTSIPSPISGENNKKWAVLAVTDLDDALSQLKDIQNTLISLLILLVIGLLVVSLIAILYLSIELSTPLEKLNQFTIKNREIEADNHFNYNFKIKEIDELYKSLNQMIISLRAGAKEIEQTWQEAKIANQLKNEFLATTSHELRTPLNGIIGSINLIKDGYCDNKEEEIEFLEKADQAAKHLLTIINDVLDISKIEAGQICLDLKPISFYNLLDEIINLQACLIKTKKLDLKVIQMYKQTIMVYADYYKLKQILINILGNAIKFTDSGTITIKTSVFKQENQLKDFLNIEITDTGIGIPMEQQAKLFQPFVMVDGSTTRKFGGTGLGLAISKNLIEMMGGSISLFSLGKNQGTTVTLTIPLAK
jgi:signal transduction histidine kinase